MQWLGWMDPPGWTGPGAQRGMGWSALGPMVQTKSETLYYK